MQDLREIAAEMHKYHDVHGHLPPAGLMARLLIAGELPYYSTSAPKISTGVIDSPSRGTTRRLFLKCRASSGRLTHGKPQLTQPELVVTGLETPFFSAPSKTRTRLAEIVDGKSAKSCWSRRSEKSPGRNRKMFDTTRRNRCQNWAAFGVADFISDSAMATFISSIMASTRSRFERCSTKMGTSRLPRVDYHGKGGSMSYVARLGAHCMATRTASL